MSLILEQQEPSIEVKENSIEAGKEVKVVEHRRKRGRPKGPQPVPSKADKKNITAQEQMEIELGFRPTLAQTIQRLITDYARLVGQQQKGQE